MMLWLEIFLAFKLKEMIMGKEQSVSTSMCVFRTPKLPLKSLDEVDFGDKEGEQPAAEVEVVGQDVCCCVIS